MFLSQFFICYSLSEKHYDVSPYVYVVNDPVKRIDVGGYTDWLAVLKGGLTTLGGASATVAGGLAIISPTFGVGQSAGVFLVSTGLPTTGLGISMMFEGFKKDKVSGNIPGGVFEVSGMVVDKAANKGDSSKPAWGRLVGEWTDFGADMKAGGATN